MTDFQKAVDDYYAMKPATYDLLKSLTLSQSVDPMNWTGVDITIQLASTPDVEAKYLSLDFRGARDIRIGSLAGLMRYLVNIRSIRGDGLEGLNYQVAEDEHSLFSFACRSFRAHICD